MRSGSKGESPVRRFRLPASSTLNGMMSEEPKVWHLAEVTVGPQNAESAASTLFDLGCIGIITLNEDDDQVTIGGYFATQPEPQVIRDRIERDLALSRGAGSLCAITLSSVPDQDWMLKWKEGFEPTSVGRRFTVAPSWNLPEEHHPRILVRIDPGMAFGTGTHETTQLCLEALEERWKGGRLLDVGTGSGILAVSAALLNRDSAVLAIDVDPEAVRIARENAELNGVASLVTVSQGQPGAFAERRFDLVVANLTAEVILDLIDTLAASTASGGTLILSGILVELASDVEYAVVRSGLSVIERRHRSEWCLLVANRP
jgi:ribosomal protein L11 methyltransferase